jgi:hypothetical protein
LFGEIGEMYGFYLIYFSFGQNFLTLCYRPPVSFFMLFHSADGNLQHTSATHAAYLHTSSPWLWQGALRSRTFPPSLKFRRWSAVQRSRIAQSLKSSSQQHTFSDWRLANNKISPLLDTYFVIKTKRGASGAASGVSQPFRLCSLSFLRDPRSFIQRRYYAVF